MTAKKNQGAPAVRGGFWCNLCEREGRRAVYSRHMIAICLPCARMVVRRLTVATHKVAARSATNALRKAGRTP